ncbi:MAG: hypothetical protein LBI48_12220 [Burkholderiaceae bacterium]|nr:hypothetical protein [Burkholderiaceae bacterium]
MTCSSLEEATSPASYFTLVTGVSARVATDPEFDTETPVAVGPSTRMEEPPAGVLLMSAVPATLTFNPSALAPTVCTAMSVP